MAGVRDVGESSLEEHLQCRNTFVQTLRSHVTELSSKLEKSVSKPTSCACCIMNFFDNLQELIAAAANKIDPSNKFAITEVFKEIGNLSISLRSYYFFREIEMKQKIYDGIHNFAYDKHESLPSTAQDFFDLRKQKHHISTIAIRVIIDLLNDHSFKDVKITHLDLNQIEILISNFENALFGISIPLFSLDDNYELNFADVNLEGLFSTNEMTRLEVYRLELMLNHLKTPTRKKQLASKLDARLRAKRKLSVKSIQVDKNRPKKWKKIDNSTNSYDKFVLNVDWNPDEGETIKHECSSERHKRKRAKHAKENEKEPRPSKHQRLLTSGSSPSLADVLEPPSTTESNVAGTSSDAGKEIPVPPSTKSNAAGTSSDAGKEIPVPPSTLSNVAGKSSDAGKNIPVSPSSKSNVAGKSSDAGKNIPVSPSSKSNVAGKNIPVSPSSKSNVAGKKIPAVSVSEKTSRRKKKRAKVDHLDSGDEVPLIISEDVSDTEKQVKEEHSEEEDQGTIIDESDEEAYIRRVEQ